MGAVATKKERVNQLDSVRGTCNIIPALNVVNSRLLLAGVTPNVALNIAVTVAL